MTVQVIPIEGIPEISAGDDLPALIVEHLPERLADGDVLVVTQKVISKVEGRVVPAGQRGSAIARESVRTLRRLGEMPIAETHQGFVCANAGVDASNVPTDLVALLPVDPDASARRIRSRLERATGVQIGVVISDTFGRAWRLGQTDVAIGVAGIEPFIDHRGTLDSFGNELRATRICIADEIAAAAELVMGKTKNICAAIVRGSQAQPGRGAATEIVRPASEDLFR